MNFDIYNDFKDAVLGSGGAFTSLSILDAQPTIADGELSKFLISLAVGVVTPLIHKGLSWAFKKIFPKKG